MRQRIRRPMVLVVLASLALATTTAPALAKGPRIMLVYGAPLAKPVVMSNWRDNATVMFAAADSTSVMHANLAHRPSLRVAMFWGLHWMRYMRHHRPLRNVRPAEADQFARFYPAYGTRPALFVFDSIPGPYTSLIRRIHAAGLRVLARYGIPIRLPERHRAA